MSDLQVSVGGRTVGVRDAGDRDGAPVVHFHGTPGSRLEVDFGADAARRLGVRLISFDRPGYGRSDAGPIALDSVAEDVEVIADALGVGRFAVSGWSGGGPFALAAASVLADRVSRVGVAGGLGPVLQVPGAREALTENDHLALSHLPDRPDRAAALFYSGNQDLLDAMMSVIDDAQAPWVDWQWSASDPEVVADPAARQALFVSFREAMRQGPMAIAWDNVAFVGPWGVDLDAITCPVHLWYGERDEMAPPAHGQWLAQQLPDAHLTIVPGEGHLVLLRHWEEILTVLSPRAQR